MKNWVVEIVTFEIIIVNKECNPLKFLIRKLIRPVDTILTTKFYWHFNYWLEFMSKDLIN